VAVDEVARKMAADPSESEIGRIRLPWRIMQYNLQSIAIAIVAAAAAAICAMLVWPVWAMFLGWVAALTVGRSAREISYSYACFVAGVGIGAVGTIAVGRLTPIIGPLANGVAVLGMASVIVSMRKAPYVNVASSYILGVLGIFALHPNFIVIGALKIAAPAAVGASGAWLASRLQTTIADLAPIP